MVMIAVRAVSAINAKIVLKVFSRWKGSFCLTLLCLFVFGCGTTTGERVRASVNAPAPDVALFSHCSAYGCQIVQQTAFADEEWQKIMDIFDPLPASAEEERLKLSEAIGLMEQFVGPKTSTNKDKAKSWLFTFMPTGQLDCIDEAINTTTYLELLKGADLIKYHTIGSIALRGGGMGFRMLHNTATLTERNSDKSFALDSWFRANGVNADVVPLNEWLDGWSPSG
jgi:hypothetical protein